LGLTGGGGVYRVGGLCRRTSDRQRYRTRHHCLDQYHVTTPAVSRIAARIGTATLIYQSNCSIDLIFAECCYAAEKLFAYFSGNI